MLARALTGTLGSTFAWTRSSAFLPDVSPEAPAVRAGERVTTYAELDRLANAYAVALLERGVGAHSVVPVAMPRSSTLIALMLAMSRVGAATAVIDLAWPAEHLREVL
jgi:non-ribosomal peptide synthetase component F